MAKVSKTSPQSNTFQPYLDRPRERQLVVL